MPRIPEFVPRVMPNTGASPGYEAPRTAPMQDATGAQLADLGGALQQAGVGVQRVGDYLTDQVDDAAAQTTYNNFAEQVQAIETAQLSRTGGNAVAAHKESGEAVRALRAKMEPTLQNGNQRKMFASRADDRSMRSSALLGRHYAAEVVRFKIGALDSGAQRAANDYVRLGHNAADKDIAVKLKGQQADLLGVDKDTKELMVLETTTALHAEALDSLIDKDPTLAAAYLRTHQGEMALKAVSRANRMIETASVDDQSTKLSMALIVAAQKEVLDSRPALNKDGPVTPEENLFVRGRMQEVLDQQYADGAITAPVRDATIRRLNAYDADRRDKQAQTVEAAVGRTLKFLLEGKQSGQGLADLDPATTDLLVTNGMWERMQNFETEGRFSTVDGELTRILGMSRADHLAKSDVVFQSEARKVLNNQDLVYVRAHRQRILGQSSREGTKILSLRERATQTARELRVDVKNEEVFVPFLLSMDEKVQRLETALGRDATDDELQERVFDPLVKDKVFVDVHGSDPQMPFYSVNTDQVGATYVDSPDGPLYLRDVHPTVVREIFESLTAAGDEVSVANVMSDWVRLKKPGPILTTSQSDANTPLPEFIKRWPSFAKPSHTSRDARMGADPRRL